ncbi:MAG: phenylacetic acid degradation bifunctional protein PaaZ [Pseudomonadota bacterium]
MRAVHSYAAGEWVGPGTDARPIESAITGEVIAQAGNGNLDVEVMRAYARDVGSPALRAMTFHERARMLKALALHLQERRETLYELSYDTGATLSDHKIDIDGGIGTMLVYASKGRRELPDAQIYLDGPPEQLGRGGQFWGRHVCAPLQGVAVHINAFNFPVWGMLEKLAPTFLAGLPAIVKPATATSYVTEACVRMMAQSGYLPEGALQMVAGGLGGLLDHLDCQDVVTFTGSAETGLKLRRNENLLANAVRFTAEQDSLNASMLCPDAAPGKPEFDLLIAEVLREMTAKAGQKCTATRRVIVPNDRVEAVTEAIVSGLQNLKIGDPRDKDTNMGALVSNTQKQDVINKCELIGKAAERVFGDPAFSIGKGAFVQPALFRCDDPDTAKSIHDVEAFGPVSTVMGYRDLQHAVALLNRGQGSLVASVFTQDPDVAREVALHSGPFHGRLYFNNRNSADEATGHGAPLPHMTHGGPGRAGGGEELGGVRAVLHYMQRTAIQGAPDILTAIGDQWVPGAKEITEHNHPFTRNFHVLKIGETLHTPPRQISLEDIEHFASFTGDAFYAHMDDEAAKANPFFPGRVAHGYLLLSFAAGLFVQPDPGPVLVNTGLDSLRFMKPVEPGDAIKVRLTVKQKTQRNDEYGEVRWHVTLTNQSNETVAEYELLTMNAI